MKVFYISREKLTINKPVAGSVALGNNCIAFMFDEIRYELDGVEIDRNRNVDVISTNYLKNYVTMLSEKSVIARNAGWDPSNGYFNFCVPLNMLLGFCEDYRCVVINARHELILIRSRNDNNYLIGDPTREPEIVFHQDFRKSKLLARLTREDETRPRSKLNFDSEARSKLSSCLNLFMIFYYILLTYQCFREKIVLIIYYYKLINNA